MDNQTEMTFWDHIQELRKRLIKIILYVFVLSIVGYIIFPYFINLISSVIKENLYALNISEGFMTRLKISIFLGLILSIPLIFFEITLFIFPALKKREKIVYFIILLSTFILFFAGIIFAYIYILPISLNFLKSQDFFPENVKRMISYKTFITFFFQFLLGFGICFEFPIVLIFLMKIGILKLKFLIKNYKYVIIVIFVIAAILTPPDITSQTALALPMILLYALTIIIAKIFKLGS